MTKKVISAGTRVFVFHEDYIWDGDDEIIDWIMEKLNVSAGDLKDSMVKEKTYFTIHCAKVNNGN